MKRHDSLLARALDIVFPRNCIVNGGPVEGPFRYLGEEALRELHLIRAPRCSLCGAPFYGVVEASRTCENCRELEPDFDEGRCLFLANGTGRAIVHELKYRKGAYMIPDVVRLLDGAGDLRPFFEGAVLVPVPLHRRRLRERGFNQSLLLARAIAEWAGGLPVADAILRVKDTPSQTNLARKTRYKNVKNAFELSPGVDLDLSTKFIVIDDVLTTGATLNASCTAIRKAGARHISVFALAHG